MEFNNLIKTITTFEYFHKLNKTKFQYLICIIIHNLSNKSNHLIQKSRITTKYKYFLNILILLPDSHQLVFYIFDIEYLSEYDLVFDLVLLID